MNPFRCSHCDKLLGMIEGKAEIKCGKCKTMNYMGNQSTLIEFLMSNVDVIDTNIPQ